MRAGITEIPKSMDIYIAEATKKKKRKERKLTNELQSIWDRIRSCMLKEKKSLRAAPRRKRDDADLRFHVDLSECYRRGFSLFLSLSPSYISASRGARHERTWENSGFSASTNSAAEVSLNFPPFKTQVTPSASHAVMAL
ncbi:hypothetical protein P5V15_012487 [Pogonomyrmex californicus]